MPCGQLENSTHAPSVHIGRDANALMEATASRFSELCGAAIAARGRFTCALSGGSTPRQLFTLLANPRLAARIDWSRVDFFWGDERCVPPDHPDSNYRMARETLLDAIKPAAERVHRMAGELAPELAATQYEELLHRFFDIPRTGPPACFDLVLLGMGDDGHTASLFPGTPAVHEAKRWVVVNQLRADAPFRLTLTFPVLNAANNIVFLVSGAGKAARVKQVLQGSGADAPLPAQLIRPTHGALEWMLDADAAAQLKPAP
jgi:6-phosphogluconolactonase